MIYLGDYAAGATVYFPFNTKAFAQTPITLAGTPVVTVYKDNATGTEVTTGVTLLVDHDTTTGLHNVAIALTDAFYAAGHDYSVVLTAGTVDGVSQVGTVIACFSIENRSAKADLVKYMGVTLTGTAAQQAAALIKLLDVATPLLMADKALLNPQEVRNALKNYAPTGGAAVPNSVDDKLDIIDGYTEVQNDRMFGITSLLNILRGLFRKDAMDATAKAEVGGTFDETTDSLQGMRDSAALEATLAAMKGAGWTVENLKAIYDALVSGVGLGDGDVEWPHEVTLDGVTVEGATVAYWEDSAYADLAARGLTNSVGVVTFHLTASADRTSVDNPTGAYYTKTFIPGQSVIAETILVTA